jgi:putative addiction module component (TIGR02574 family)
MMSTLLIELTDQALNLPLSERSILEQRLWDSLDDFIDPDIEEAWIIEAEKRWQEIEQGKVECIPVEEVMNAIRSSLKRTT